MTCQHGILYLDCLVCQHAKEIADLQQRLADADRQLAQTRVQLAGCSVAATGWAKGKLDCKPGDYGYSASFQDVKRLRFLFEDARSDLKQMLSEKAEMRQIIKEQTEAIEKFGDQLTERDARIKELEQSPLEWEGSGYTPQKMARLVKQHQKLQRQLADLRSPSPCGVKGHLKVNCETVEEQPYMVGGDVVPGPDHEICHACRQQQEAVREARANAVEQCAIEAGERSPEGVSSHTMLGNMWDERIRTLREQAGQEPK